jgi:hypothetical protein
MKPSHATLVRGRSNLLVAFAAICSAAPAHAGTVIVFDTGGPGGRGVVEAMTGTLQGQLAAHEVRRESRPRVWRSLSVERAPAIAEAVSAAGAEIGLDSIVSGTKRRRKLTVLAVTAGGEIVFDKTTRLPRKSPEKKAAGLAGDIARAMADELDRAPAASAGALPAGPAGEVLDDSGASARHSEGGPAMVDAEAPTSADAPELQLAAIPVAASEVEAIPAAANEAEAIPPAAGEAEAIPPAAGEAEAIPLAASEVEERPVRERDRGEPFHVALWLGGGVLRYSDEIATTIDGGDLQINLGSTVVANAGLEMQILDIVRVDVMVRRHTATMTHTDPGNPAVERVQPDVIDMTTLGGTALGGAVFDVGPIGIGALAGASYDRLDASAQTLADAHGVEQTVALVPSWTRFMLLAGATVDYGNLGTEGLTAQVALIAAPWGSNAEEPVTSGDRNRLLGGVGWLRLRYQLTDLLGPAGGLFAEGRGDIEYLRIQYEGIGTRTALGGNTPVQASKEARLSFSGGLSLGYIF